MINIRSILKLKNNDGLTLKNGKPITKGKCPDCGTADGIYYIDKSHRVSTKREAMEIGRAHNQISVLNWRTMGLAYC